VKRIALLRAVNVAGHHKVAMTDLRSLMSELGFVDTVSVLQTGNLVFSGGPRTVAAVERLLEEENGQAGSGHRIG
jgi:uncharacterized protein (DUF1697 family)